MTRDEYNANIQDMQLMFANTRVKPVYSDGSNHLYPSGQLLEAQFQVYWNGQWHTVGWERRPMTPEVECSWNETLQYRLMGEFSASLAHS